MSALDRPSVVALVSALAADSMLFGAMTFVALTQSLSTRPHAVSPWVFAPLAAMTLVSVALVFWRVPTVFSALAVFALGATVRRPHDLASLLALAQFAHALLALGALARAKRLAASPFARWSSSLLWHHATALGWMLHGGLRVVA